jgi:succinate-acetate transporter protein
VSSAVPATPAVSPTENLVAPKLAAPADPGSLGLAAFALTTFVLSIANAGLVPEASASVGGGALVYVLGLALFYGGIAQIIAGVWELVNKNTFGATAFTSYGAFWLAFWFLQVSGGAGEAGKIGVGIFLLGWTIFTAYMTVAARFTTLSIFAVFVALTITFALLTAGDLSGVVAFSRVGGWFGILTALLAWYGSFAVVLNATAGRIILPTRPYRRAA